MTGIGTGGFTLAIVAILTVFAALLLFAIGQTAYGILSSRKSSETGQVNGAVVRKGIDTPDGVGDSKPAVEVEEEDDTEPLKSYDPDELDDLEFNFDE